MILSIYIDLRLKAFSDRAVYKNQTILTVIKISQKIIGLSLPLAFTDMRLDYSAMTLSLRRIKHFNEGFSFP